MEKSIRILSVFLFFILAHSAYGQVDNYAKNSKLNSDEQARFVNELKTNMDSAQVYWKHANVLAAFTFNAYKSAGKFYEKAISIDSSKDIYFVDYANYLYQKLNSFEHAKGIYNRGLKLFPGNAELRSNLVRLNQDIAALEENKYLRSLGNAPPIEGQKATDYSKITDFENLAKQTKDKKSKFYYQYLLSKFKADSNLKDEEVYMLLIGFTQQDEYKPYGEESELVYQLNNQEYYDEAINKANALLKNNPLMPSLHQELMYAYLKNGNQTLADNSRKKMQVILNAMLYTGDGSCNKPYVAFWVHEEYTLLKYLEYKKTGPVTMGSCAGQMVDKIEVKNLKTDERTVINFNIMPIFKKATGK